MPPPRQISRLQLQQIDQVKQRLSGGEEGRRAPAGDNTVQSRPLQRDPQPDHGKELFS